MVNRFYTPPIDGGGVGESGKMSKEPISGVPALLALARLDESELELVRGVHLAPGVDLRTRSQRKEDALPPCPAGYIDIVKKWGILRRPKQPGE